MFRQAELNIPIERVAEALGLRLGLVKDMFYSPERDESEASLHIDRSKNVWYDHGSGKGGTNADISTFNTEGKLSKEPSSKNVAVFEGFFDSLSWQVMQEVANVNGRRMP